MDQSSHGNGEIESNHTRFMQVRHHGVVNAACFGDAKRRLALFAVSADVAAQSIHFNPTMLSFDSSMCNTNAHTYR